MPQKLMKDLARAILDDKGAVQVENGKVLLAFSLRHVIDEMSKKVVINLDATPNLYLLAEIFGPNKLRRCFKVEVPDLNIRVTQVPSYLYTKRVLNAKPETQEELEKLIAYFIQEYERPLIVADKAFVEQSSKTGNHRLRVDHAGAKPIYFGYETRSSNNYQDCDCVVIAMNWLENLNSISRKVGALRRSKPRPRIPDEDYVDARRKAGLDYRPYFRN